MNCGLGENLNQRLAFDVERACGCLEGANTCPPFHVRRADGPDTIGEVRVDLMDGRKPSPSRQRFHHAAHGIQPPFRQRLEKNPARFCVEFGDLLT